MSLFILCHISCTFTFIVVFLLCRTCCSAKPNNRFTSDVTVVVILHVAIEKCIDCGDGDVLTVSMSSIFFISFKESSSRGSKVTAPNRMLPVIVKICVSCHYQYLHEKYSVSLVFLFFFWCFCCCCFRCVS